MRNVCTEAGMFAIRAERDYVQEEDFSKAVRKVAESKKLESKFDYKAQGTSQKFFYFISLFFSCITYCYFINEQERKKIA